MPDCTSDRNALPAQNPDAFEKALGDEPEKRLRLQEIADALPALDGVGERLDEAKKQVTFLLADLDRAEYDETRAQAEYDHRKALYSEEREILQSLGLTQNLFR